MKITKTSLLKDIMGWMKILYGETYFQYNAYEKKFYWTCNSSSGYTTKKNIELLIEKLLDWKDLFLLISLLNGDGNPIIVNQGWNLKFYDATPFIL